MKPISLLVLTLFLFTFSNTNAQKSNTPYSLQVQYQQGEVFLTNNFLKGENSLQNPINSFQSIGLRFEKQTIGKDSWVQLYHYPKWGLGMNVTNFYNRQELGLPISLLSFINIPFIKKEKWSFNTDLEFGLTFNWKYFSPKNHLNVSIGAPATVHLAAGLNIEYRLGPRMDLGIGYTLSHFSNGALKRPNKGINTGAPKLGFRYYFRENENTFIQSPKLKPNSSNELLLTIFMGNQNFFIDSSAVSVAEKYEGVNFAVAGLTAAFNRYLGQKSKFGIGATITYDGSFDAQLSIEEGGWEKVATPTFTKINLSVFPSYELDIGDITLLFQAGFYLFRKQREYPIPNWYQRVGIRYRFSENIFAGVNLRAINLYQSNFLEFNVSYRFSNLTNPLLKKTQK